MSLGYLSISVATVLTACGIETPSNSDSLPKDISLLQQCLPLAVLKRKLSVVYGLVCEVATVLTACGIETTTSYKSSTALLIVMVATVLTACGIETILGSNFFMHLHKESCNSAYRLRY